MGYGKWLAVVALITPALVFGKPRRPHQGGRPVQGGPLSGALAARLPANSTKSGALWVPGAPISDDIIRSFPGLAGPGRTELSPSLLLNLARSQIESQLVGQPEVVDALLALERQQLVVGSGKRARPEVLWLMGLPGTGKDTAVYAYADALHGLGKGSKHVYRLPVPANEGAYWELFGPAAGYIGSGGDPTDFVAWLAEISGGRYQLSQKERRKVVVETEDRSKWLGGEDAILFVDEFHDWPKDAKSQLLKAALERGAFRLPDPGSGVREIEFRGTIIIASNDGAGLITSVDPQGNPIGEPQDFDSLMRKWQRVASDKDRLLKDVRLGRRDSLGRSVGSIAEEVLSRIPKNRIHLLRPLSPEAARRIVEIELNALKGRLAEGKGRYGTLHLAWTEDLVDFLHARGYSPEKGAREIRSAVAHLVAEPFYQGIEKYLKPVHPNVHTHLNVDVRQDSRGSWSLVINQVPGM